MNQDKRAAFTERQLLSTLPTSVQPVIKPLLGQTITGIVVNYNETILRFGGDPVTQLRLWDSPDCCEDRYMSTDDDLAYYEGAKLVDVEIREAPPIEETNSVEHEMHFLVIKTDRGEFVVEQHNEHNGYYGGLSLNASREVRS